MAAEGESVHIGHLDVGHHEIRTQAVCKLKGLLAVFRLPDQLEAETSPIDPASDSAADFLLVIDEQHAVR